MVAILWRADADDHATITFEIIANVKEWDGYGYRREEYFVLDQDGVVVE